MNHTFTSKPDDANFGFSSLKYDLPQELIAQQPLDYRDASRLLVVDRASAKLNDRQVGDLPTLVRQGDLLVLNDTKVLPARFAAKRATGGHVGGLFVSAYEPGDWCVMLEGSRRLKIGESLTLAARTGDGCTFELVDRVGRGLWRVRVTPIEPPEVLLARIGITPLPPYIRRNNEQASDADGERYQTVYAASPGAIAAPTAGLHLTNDLLDIIRRNGVHVAFVTLHVGVGTFEPIRVKELDEHDMHEERFELPPETVTAVQDCRERGGRVVAVGTTSVRVLESAACADGSRTVQAQSGDTKLFIRPPYSFRVVDALMTNFHLPESTLLALVMAMVGVDETRRAYEHAIRQKYRFYSYGDAMFIQ